MTTRRLFALLIVAIAVTVTYARTHRFDGSSPEIRTYEGTGAVTAPPVEGRVTVAHEAILGYMPAMTMPFTIAEDAPKLAAGDRINFRLRVDDDSSWIERVVVVGHDPAIAAAARSLSATQQRLKKGDALPAFSLTTNQGHAFTVADIRGRRTAITFIFTRCPMPEFCPLMVKRFQQLQREIERDRALADVQLVSVTLDPGFDTPAVLDAYAKAMGANSNRWRFVTGQAEEVARLTQAFSIHIERNGVLLDHTLATAILDTDGRVLEMWRGNGWTTADLTDVLRRQPGVTTARAGDR